MMNVLSTAVETSGKRKFVAVVEFVSVDGLRKFHQTLFDDYRDAVSFIEAHEPGMTEDQAIDIHKSFFPQIGD